MATRVVFRNIDYTYNYVSLVLSREFNNIIKTSYVQLALVEVNRGHTANTLSKIYLDLLLTVLKDMDVPLSTT